MATKATPGASAGTWGTDTNAFLDVSLAADGKIKTEALQTDSTAPVLDAALANKKYVDTKESIIVTQATVSIFGDWTNKDSAGTALAKDEVYKVGSDGFICAYSNATGEEIQLYTDGSNPPTTMRVQNYSQLGSKDQGLTVPIRKDDYFELVNAETIFWIPFGTGTCVKQ